MKIKLLTGILGFLLMSCGNNEKVKSPDIPVQNFKNKGHQLVYNMVQKVGDYAMLLDKKDVVYTYSYQTPDGQADVSTEKYIFDGELSYASYNKHQRTLPQLDGLMEQGYDGKEFWLKHNENILTDEKLMPRVIFNRATNFYWFTMMQKLLDDGIKYEYKGDTLINDTNYEIVKVSFITNNDKPTDIYQLYINKDTGIVDQFLFTVADFGVMDTPFLMELEYESIDGLLMPTKRRYKASTWDAEVTDAPWILVKWTNIKFDNKLITQDFKI